MLRALFFGNNRAVVQQSKICDVYHPDARDLWVNSYIISKIKGAPLTHLLFL